MTAIDPSALKGLVDDMGGDREILKELVESYFDEAPKLLAAGRAGVLAKDADAVQHAYHPLKSTSATFGALRLSNLCRELEQAARAGAVPTLDQVAAIEAEYKLAHAELTAKFG